MITQRSDYQLVDVTKVPSITGDILPVRDGTARAHILKMEDLAFLAEAFAERGLMMYDPVHLLTYMTPVPNANFFYYCIGGLNAAVTAEDVADGASDVVYGNSGYSQSAPALLRRHIPLRDSVAFPAQIAAASSGGSDLLSWTMTNLPTLFWWSSELPVHSRDFIGVPVAASYDRVRRVYYLLKSMRRWLVYPLSASSDEGWRILLLSGTADVTQYSYREVDGQAADEHTIAGSSDFSGKTQTGTVTVQLTEGSTSKGASILTTQIAYRITTSYSDTPASGSTLASLSYSRDVVTVSPDDCTFKTKISYSSLATFFTVSIRGSRYARRDGDVSTTATDSLDYVVRTSCTKVADLQDDPDGYVQQWRADTTRLSGPYLPRIATDNGFHIPTTTAAGQGQLSISVIGLLALDGYPTWRTEIDSTGWNWSPAAT